MALDWHDPRTASLARLSYALYQDLAGEFDGDTVFGYGQLQSFSLKKSTESAKDTLAAHIHQFRLQPPSLGTAALDAVGWLQDVRVQSLDVISKEDTTAQVNPAAFTRTLFHESQKAGVTYCHGRATSLNEETKTLNVFTSDGEIQIPIDKLIITCGPWSGKVAKKLLNLDIPISYLPGHSILIRPSESVPPQAIFSQILGENMSLSPEIFVWRNGMVYVAGENNGPPLPDGTSSVKVDPTAIDKLINASKELSSLLANGAIEVQQVRVENAANFLINMIKQLCYRPITSQGVPLIGKLRSGSVKAFIAAGHGPWGITLGPGNLTKNSFYDFAFIVC